MMLLPGRPAPTLRVWLRHNVWFPLLAMRRPAGDTGSGWIPRREFGGWSVRPRRGWRRWPYVTPPLFYTRAIPACDEMAAGDWAMEKLGIGV